MESSPKLCGVHIPVSDLQTGQCVQGDTLRKVEFIGGRVKIVVVFQIWRLPALWCGKAWRESEELKCSGCKSTEMDVKQDADMGGQGA